MAHPGTLHRYTNRLVAFEHHNPASNSQRPPRNTLLYIGGLSDGLLTNTYPSKIAAHLPPNWRVAEVLLSSSYSGWATGSIARDARELGECVTYFRSLNNPAREGKDEDDAAQHGEKEEEEEQGKVVLLGCSTGCQDALEYAIGSERSTRPRINGIILQAGVSDREAWHDIASRMPSPTNPSETLLSFLTTSLAHATKMVKQDGAGDNMMPTALDVVRSVMGDPTTAYRTWSLLARGGDEDFFSTDLADEDLRRTFGAIGPGVRVGLLWGSEDEYVPKTVDKDAVLRRWARFVTDGGAVLDERCTGVMRGASHTLNQDPEEVVRGFIERVVGFLERVE